jgi:hypothetical protein
MNKKLRQLKEAIEESLIDFDYVAVYKDKFVLIYHVTHDEFTYEITVKDDCYIVIEKFYSEVTGVTIEGNSKFNTLEEVIDFIL